MMTVHQKLLEYWEQGGNKYNTKLQKSYKESRDNLLKIATDTQKSLIYDYEAKTMTSGLSIDEWAKAYESVANLIDDENFIDKFWDYAELREAVFNKADDIDKSSPYDLYRMTVGEIESRDVTNRIDYTAE